MTRLFLRFAARLVQYLVDVFLSFCLIWFKHQIQVKKLDTLITVHYWWVYSDCPRWSINRWIDLSCLTPTCRWACSGNYYITCCDQSSPKMKSCTLLYVWRLYPSRGGTDVTLPSNLVWPCDMWPNDTEGFLSPDFKETRQFVSSSLGAWHQVSGLPRLTLPCSEEAQSCLERMGREKCPVGFQLSQPPQLKGHTYTAAH